MNVSELQAKLADLQKQKQAEQEKFAEYERNNADTAKQHVGLNMKALSKQIKWIENKLKQKFYAAYDGQKLVFMLAIAGVSFVNTSEDNDVLHVHVRVVTDVELYDDVFALSALRAAFSSDKYTVKPISQQEYEQAVIKAVTAFHEPVNDAAYNASKRFVAVFREHVHQMQEIDKQIAAIDAAAHTLPYDSIDSLLAYLASL